jgi:pimeloyl-ACP methyl ester carboxylesterase
MQTFYPRENARSLRRACLIGSFGIAAITLLAACSAPKNVKNTTLAFEDCRIKRVESQAKCVQFDVPEDHAKPNDKKIKIHVALVPSLAPKPEPDPVFMFAGGPGQAASDIGSLVEALSPLRRNRDVILVDQRGTGKSKTLTCELGNALSSNVEALEQAFNVTDAQMKAEWKKCLDTLKGNAATHRTDDYIADLELVRKALGYDKINVWGGSYGSRVALRYMKLHPDVIRTSIVDGVAPTTLRLPNDALANSEAELRAAFAACAQMPECAKAHPNIAKKLDDLLASLKVSPKVVTVIHPATGKPFNATITNVSFATMLWPLLYQPDGTRMLPVMINEAANGNYAPFATALYGGTSVGDMQIAIAQRFAVMCAEDMYQQTPQANERLAPIANLFFEFCASFPHGRPAENFFEATKSVIPTLLLSGSHDPVTPASSAEVAMKTLSSSKHIVVAGAGHIVSPHPCVRRTIKKFVDAGNIAAANDSCEAELKLPRPLFYTSTLEAK